MGCGTSSLINQPKTQLQLKKIDSFWKDLLITSLSSIDYIGIIDDVLSHNTIESIYKSIQVYEETILNKLVRKNENDKERRLFKEMHMTFKTKTEGRIVIKDKKSLVSLMFTFLLHSKDFKFLSPTETEQRIEYFFEVIDRKREYNSQLNVINKENDDKEKVINVIENGKYVHLYDVFYISIIYLHIISYLSLKQVSPCQTQKLLKKSVYKYLLELLNDVIIDFNTKKSSKNVYPKGSLSINGVELLKEIQIIYDFIVVSSDVDDIDYVFSMNNQSLLGLSEMVECRRVVSLKTFVTKIVDYIKFPDEVRNRLYFETGEEMSLL